MSLFGLIQLPDDVAEAMEKTISQVQSQADQEAHAEVMQLMGDE